MASSLDFLSDESEEAEMPKDVGFHLEVHETNYHFEKRMIVHR